MCRGIANDRSFEHCWMLVNDGSTRRNRHFAPVTISPSKVENVKSPQHRDSRHSVRKFRLERTVYLRIASSAPTLYARHQFAVCLLPDLRARSAPTCRGYSRASFGRRTGAVPGGSWLWQAGQKRFGSGLNLNQLDVGRTSRVRRTSRGHRRDAMPTYPGVRSNVLEFPRIG